MKLFPKPPRWLRLRKLPLKIALAQAAATAGLLVLVDLYGAGYGIDLSFWFIVAPALILGAVAYGIAHRFLSYRIELARSTLKQIRKYQFENLEAVQIKKGDELNALIWQVYRTGLALEKEFRELKKMENYRREFLGNVSHELKTPIFAIQGFAETLLNGALQDERVNQTFVRKILNNTDRLRNLSNDLMEISRIETGELKMTIEPFDLKEVVREVAEGLEPLAAARDIALQYQMHGQLPEVLGDRERIRQVLSNLTDNAIKYNNQGGYVEIVARVLPGGDIKVSVVDNGIGIAPQHISRITERFYRVDKSRSRSQGGTGLGLAIVKHILGAHQTQMSVESKLGHGSTFGFNLHTVRSRTPTARSPRPEAMA